MCISHESIELRSPFLCSGNADVNIFAGDGPTAALAIFAKLSSL
jgi:hypothetical protein